MPIVPCHESTYGGFFLIILFYLSIYPLFKQGASIGFHWVTFAKTFLMFYFGARWTASQTSI